MILGSFTKHDSAGVTSLKLHRALDIISADGGKILVDGSQLSGTELGVLDGVTAGTVTASKALVVDANKAIGAFCLSNRLTTGTVAGSAVSMDATTWAYSEGVELRYVMADWADGATTHTSAKGMYLRMENTEANASGSIYGAEIYGVANNVNTQYLWGSVSYAYVKGTSAKALTGVYAFQPELSFDAGSATNTITEACVVRGKVTGGAMSAYTALHGYKLIAGDMDGGSRTYGNAFWVVDDGDMSGTCGWTVGLNLAAACTTGISIAGASTTGISITGATSQGLLIGTSAASPQTVTSTGTTNMLEVNSKLNAASGTLRGILSYAEFSGTHVSTTMNCYAIRGYAKMSGTAGAGNTNYTAGVQGKLELSGTVGGGKHCAVLAQLNSSAGLTGATGGTVYCLWADGMQVSQTPAAGLNMTAIGIELPDAATRFDSAFYVYGGATYLFDIQGEGVGGTYAATYNQAPAAATGTLKCRVGSTDVYLLVTTDPTA